VGIFNITPHIGYRAIGFGNSPQHNSKFLAQGIVGAEAHTRFTRSSQGFSHAVEPYVQYDYFSNPTVNPHKHYLFDLEDGLYRQNSLRYGARNFFRFKHAAQLNMDLYARSFINTPHFKRHIPYIYLDSTLRANDFTEYSLNTAWDTRRKNLSYFNVRSDITVSENLAFGLEYRHRNAYAWRKVDYENFMIDTYRSQHALRHSLMSDKRDTFLAHVFLRVTPQLAFEFATRHGWGRKHAHNYTEYEVNCFTLIKNAFRLTLTFRHRATGNDYSIDFALGGGAHTADMRFRKIGQGNYNLP
jgi:hypothetical protein